MIKNIQALRALAANGVLLSHLAIVEQKYGQGFRVLGERFHLGASGVDLFFVISGFIMVMIGMRERPRDFLIARGTRIYPIYWFYLSGALLVFLVAPGAVNSSFSETPQIWRSYLLLPDRVYPLLAVGWTLIHEVYFYLVFAAFLALGLPLMPLLGGWAIVVILGGLGLGPIQQAQQPLLSVVFHPMTLEFIFGAVTGLLVFWERAHLARAALATGAVLLLIAACLPGSGSIIDLEGWGRVLLFGGPYALLLYGCASVELRGGAAAGQALVAIGNASYSLYLSHVLLLSGLGRLFLPMPWHGYPAEAGFVVLAIAAANLWALLSYRFIERPSLRVARSIAARVFGPAARAG